MFVFSFFNDSFLVKYFGQYILKIISMVFIVFNFQVILKNIKSMYLLQDKMFFLFFIALLISFLITSLIDMPDNLIDSVLTFIFIMIIIIYFIRYPLEKLLYFIWLSMFISIIVCYFNDPITEWTFRKGGGALDPNQFAAETLPFILTAIYLFKINKSKVFLLMSMTSFIYGVFNAGSKSAFLVLGIILIIIILKYLIYNLKIIFSYKFILSFFIILLVSTQIDFYKIKAVSNILGRTKNMETAEYRFISWNAGRRMIEEYPFVGVGMNRFGENTHKYAETKIAATSAHNAYIKLLAESGIFVFIFFIGFLFTVLMKNFHVIINSNAFWIYLSFVSILLMAMTLSILYDKFLWLYVAILMNVHYLIRNKKPI